MSRNVRVLLITLLEHKDLVNKLIEELDDSDKVPDEQDELVDDRHALLLYEYFEIYDGILGMEAEMRERGIPYSKECGDVYDSVEPWEDHLRIDKDGIRKVTRIAEGSKSLTVHDLMKVINSPQALDTMIRSRHADLTILPWEDQLKNREIFLRRKSLNLT